jgi:hypothetical protein
MTYTPMALPLQLVPSFARSESSGTHLNIAMRLGILCLLVPALSGLAFADALLSISATAGTQSCSQASAASASCSVSSSVYLPAGQFYSPVSAGGSISFGPTSFQGALGPQTPGPLDYSLQGNWAMGQGIGLSGQAAVSLTASINLLSDSGNWTFYGTSYDATDDQGGELGPIQIVTTDGSGWILGGSASSFTVDHTPGTPFSVSLSVSDIVEESNSSNDFNFDVRMVDPIATPEPATWLLVHCAAPLAFLPRKFRISR